MNPITTSRRRLLRTGATLGAVALAGCGTDTSDSTATEQSPTAGESTGATEPGAEPTYAVEPVADGLSSPWGLAFLSGGSKLLVTEQPGRLQLLDLTAGSMSQVAGVPEVFASGQGGLLDVAVGPDAESPWVYLTYSATNQEGASATHLSRGRLDVDASRLTDREELHVARPFVDANAHYGSRVVVGADDMLYLTVGDRHFKNFGPDHVAQDPTNELGTVLRLAPDGSVPSDNPFVGESGKRDTIFSYGHRNPQGLTVHPETGALWESEHGERDGDEINVIEAGENYGWPLASEACHYGSDEPVGDSHEERDEFVDPVHFWPCGSGGFPPSGMTFYDGDAFPGWQGDLFAGTLAGKYLGHFTVEGRTVQEVDPILTDRGWRIRAVEVAPKTGELYVAVDAGSAPIVKLTPA